MLVVGRHVLRYSRVGMGTTITMMKSNTLSSVVNFYGISRVNDLYLFSDIRVRNAVKVPIPTQLNVVVLLYFVAGAVFHFERGRR